MDINRFSCAKSVSHLTVLQKMNCLIRIENVDRLEVDGYERIHNMNVSIWVFEVARTQTNIESLLEDIESILEKQKKELKEMVIQGAKVILFFEHEENRPVKIENKTITLLGEIGAELEIYNPKAEPVVMGNG